MTPASVGELVLPLREDARRRESFEEIVAAHRQLVLRTAYRLLGDLTDAQDAAQEVLLRLFKHLDRIDGDPRPWLYRVTVNVCHDHRRVAQASACERAVPGAETDWPDPAPGPHRVLEMEERKRLLMEALAKLPQREREAVVLRDIEELPTREVAQIMGVEEVTVRSQISMARLKLAKYVRSRS